MSSNFSHVAVSQSTGGIAVTDQMNENTNGQKQTLAPIPGGSQTTIAIDPNQPLTLSVSNASGDVSVTGADRQDIAFTARLSGGHEGDANADISVSVNGNQVSIRPAWQSIAGFGEAARALKEQIQEGLSKGKWNFSGVPKLGSNAEYDFALQVPRALMDGSRVNVKTASGDVVVEGLKADVTVGTASGDTAVRTLSGEVAIHTASGDVQARDVTGSLEVNTASGDIRVDGGDAWTALRTMSGELAVTDSVLRNARITTVSGDLTGVMTLDNVADYTFETVSGDLSLACRLPADATSRLTFRSISGEASTNEGWTTTGKKEWKIGQGDAGPSIRTRSVSGNLRVAGSLVSDLHLRRETPRTPQPAGASETAQPQSGIDELKSYAAQAREMADEMKRMFTGPTPPASPTPPTPPTPPTAPASPADLNAEQAQRDAEQRLRNAEQAQRDAEQAQRNAEQAQRDAERQMRDQERAQRQGAAAQGADWWAERAEVETQHTAPITPPATPPQATAPIQTPAAQDDDPERRKVLEQVERGEIDIEEALNRLDQTDGETV